MARPTLEQIRQVAHELVGQCEKDIDDICQENGYPLFDEWASEDCTEFDTLAFRCDRCNWWYEAGEIAENGPEEEMVCESCLEG